MGKSTVIYIVLLSTFLVKGDVFGSIGGGIFASSPQPQSPATQQLPSWSANRTYYDTTRATNLHGRPMPSMTASQAIGTRGHVLMQDWVLIEKMATFNRERIPERVVHAKGAGAHGVFEVTHDVSKYTKAKFLNDIGKKTPLFVRFSTVAGERGTADTLTDPHGFAVKFYTEDGNHDLVGNNIEVFPVRDPMVFVDLNRARKRNPQTNLYDKNMWWDVTALRPEMTHHTLHLFSDLGRPDGFRRMNGAGVHAFKLVNKKGDLVFCKFHWRSNQPGRALTHLEALALDGSNPEYKTQDLFDAIARKDYPSWNLFLQVMTLDQARKHPRNPFDITRMWRVEEYPLIPVGRMTLNRNPINYHAEVEQAGFAPNNMVPGIEPSPDRMLGARLFAYQDAQRYRLGVNAAQLPVNRPVAPVTSYIRDGAMCYGENGNGSPNYFPNSWGGHIVDTEGAGQPTFAVEGIVDRYDEPEDEYVEARIFLQRDVDPAQRKRMVEAIAAHMAPARKDVRERCLQTLFYPVEKKLGEEVREALDRAVAALRANATSSTSRDRDFIDDHEHDEPGWPRSFH